MSFQWDNCYLLTALGGRPCYLSASQYPFSASTSRRLLSEAQLKFSQLPLWLTVDPGPQLGQRDPWFPGMLFKRWHFAWFHLWPVSISPSSWPGLPFWEEDKYPPTKDGGKRCYRRRLSPWEHDGQSCCTNFGLSLSTLLATWEK